MLILSSDTDRPDREFLFRSMEKSLDEGIQIYIPQDLKDKAEADKTYLERQFIERHGVQNPNSSQQVQRKLQELSYEHPEIAEHCYDERKGAWTSKADKLNQIQTLGIQFVDDLLLYRNITAYTKALNSLEKYMDSRGRVHPKLSFLVTNRISYSEPGLMSIPKEILWNVVRPRKDGWYAWSIDIKNQEPWIFINRLNITKLKQLLRISGELGLYRLIYQDIYGVQPEPAAYKEIKVAWNALTYGSTKKALLDSTFHMGETPDRPSDHGEAFYKWFNAFPEIKEYHKRINSMAYSGQREIQTVFGTKIQAEGSKQQLARRLMDYWIQGTAADILAFLVQSFVEFTYQYNVQDHMNLYFARHDEIVIEMSPEMYRKFPHDAWVSKLKFLFSHSIDDWDPCGLDVKLVGGPGVNEYQ